MIFILLHDAITDESWVSGCCHLSTFLCLLHSLFHSLAYTCTAKNEQINKINAMKSCTVQSTLWKWSFCGSDSGSKVWTYPLQDVSFLYAYWVGYIALICVILINPNLTPNCAGLFLGFLAWRDKLHLPKCFANLHNVKNSKINRTFETLTLSTPN